MDIKVEVGDIDLTTVIGSQHTLTGGDEWGAEYGETPQTLGEAVAHLLAEELKKDPAFESLRGEVLQLRTELVREQLAPIVTEAINGPITPTNMYGEPIRGQQTTLRELIMQEAKTLLTNRSDHGRGPTLLQKSVQDAVAAAMRQELAAAIAEEKEKVVTAVRASAAELIAEAVKKGIGR